MPLAAGYEEVWPFTGALSIEDDIYTYMMHGGKRLKTSPEFNYCTVDLCKRSCAGLRFDDSIDEAAAQG